MLNAETVGMLVAGGMILAAVAIGSGAPAGLDDARRVALVAYLVFCAGVFAAFKRASHSWSSPWSPSPGARFNFLFNPVVRLLLLMICVVNLALAWEGAFAFAVPAMAGAWMAFAPRQMLRGPVPQSAIEEAALDMVHPGWRDRDFWPFVWLTFLRAGVVCAAGLAVLIAGQHLFDGLSFVLFADAPLTAEDLARAPFRFAADAVAEIPAYVPTLIFFAVVMFIQPMLLLLGAVWILLFRRGDEST